MEVVAIDITFHTCYVCERREGGNSNCTRRKKLYPIVASIKKDLKLKPLRYLLERKKMKNELSCGILEEKSVGGGVATVVDRIYGTKLNLM